MSSDQPTANGGNGDFEDEETAEAESETATEADRRATVEAEGENRRKSLADRRTGRRQAYDDAVRGGVGLHCGRGDHGQHPIH